MKIYSLIQIFILINLIYNVDNLIAQDFEQFGAGSDILDNRQDSVFNKSNTVKRLRNNVKELLYDSKSTFYFTENHILNGDMHNNIDTLVRLLHRYDFNAKNNYLYQDLGSLGSPIQPVFYQQPRQIGQSLGFNRLNYYILEPENVKYYNTYSPFTRLNYADGGDKRTDVSGIFSRNINPNWNIGFGVYRLSSRVLLGNRVFNTDRAAIFDQILFHSNHISKKKRYVLLLHVNLTNLRLTETGGLNTDEELDVNNRDEFFTLNFRTLDNRLEGISSKKRKNWAYLYQHYQIKDNRIALFNRIRYTVERYVYRDANYNENQAIYPDLLVSTLNNPLDDTVRFKTLSTTLGFKGQIKDLSYSFSTQLNTYQYKTVFLDSDTIGKVDSTIALNNQIFYHGKFKYTLAKHALQFNISLIDRNQFILNLEYHSPLLFIKARRIKYQPSLLQSIYRNNFFSWDNRDSLRHTFANEVTAGLSLKVHKTLKIEPYFSYKYVKDLVFWDTASMVNQFDRNIMMGQIGMNLSFQNKFLKQYLSVKYTFQNFDEVLRQPTLWATYYIYIYFKIKKAIDVQVGLDLHWHSEYFSDSYNPVLQQFHIQNISRVGNYLQGETFVLIGFRKTTLFGKVTNILEGLLRKGYFSTLDYVAQRRVFSFGFRWYFFD